MKVILGLGNPGRSFAKSRHNVGFRCIDALAHRHSIGLEERRRHAVLGHGDMAGVPVVLAKPRTYMNRSGVAARYLLDRFHVGPEDLLVVYDDMDLPIGTIRLRAGGGAAGHHGIESIMAELGTREFPRLRIGVGHPPDREHTVSHVLGPFTAEEAKAIEEPLERAVAAAAWVMEYGLESAMNHFN